MSTPSVAAEASPAGTDSATPGSAGQTAPALPSSPAQAASPNRAARPPFADWFPDAPMDATYGYDLAALLQIPAPDAPEDFAQFWRRLYTAAREVAPAPELADYPMTSPAHTLHRVDFTSLGGLRLGGWVALPKGGPARVGVVVSHGYGGREAPDLAGIPEDAAAIFPVARGLPSVSLMPQVRRPTDGHVLEGIDSREKYVLGGCAADVWCAASALHQLVGEVPLVFVGASFGGGQGALALPWDFRFVAGALRVPTFGQYDIRLKVACTGSGERVREYVSLHPRAREVLRYFDAATAASFLTMPTLFACALWDPSVPPPGQFAVYNAAREATGEAARLQVLSAGHAEYPQQVAENAVWLRGSRDLIAAAPLPAAPLPAAPLSAAPPLA